MRHRRLGGAGVLSFAAFLVAVGFAGCDAGQGGSNVQGDGEGGSGKGGSEDLPCGIDCSTIQTDTCSEAVCEQESGVCKVVPLSDLECDDGLF